MKKICSAGIILATSVLLSACGATARTPTQVLQASATKTEAVQSMKMDMDISMSGSISANTYQCGPDSQLPASMNFMSAQWAKMTPADRARFCQNLAANVKQVPTSFSATMIGNGVFKAPANMKMSMTMTSTGASTGTSSNGESFKIETITVDGKTYVKNPMTGAWTTNPAGQVDTSSFGQTNPASNTALLEAAKSVKDLGDVSLGDVRTHHYSVVLDSAKIQEIASKKAVFKNPDMRKLVQQYASIYGASTTTVEVWIGVNDDLLRRMVMDMQPTGDAASSGGLPISNMKMKLTMNFHDFGAKVDIKAPTVTQ